MMDYAGDVPRLQNGKGFRFQPACDAYTIGGQLPAKGFGETVVVFSVFDQLPENLGIRALVQEDSDRAGHLTGKMQVSYEMRAEMDEHGWCSSKPCV